MYTSVGIKLKELRKKNNFSQAYVAEFLNISRQAISNWENGKSVPDLENIVLLAKLYDVTTDELLGNTIASSTNPLNTTNSRDSVLEMLGLSIILVLSTLFPIVPIIISVFVAYWLKKNNRKYTIVYILCVLCLLIGVYNSYIFFIHIIPNTGSSTIVKV